MATAAICTDGGGGEKRHGGADAGQVYWILFLFDLHL